MKSNWDDLLIKLIRGLILLIVILLLIILGWFSIWFLGEAPAPTRQALAKLFGAAFVIGWIYALIIYHRPFPDGWTWLSVVIGEVITETTTTIILYIVLVYLELFQNFWWILLAPWLGEALGGTPMIISQLWKLYTQIKDNSKMLHDYIAGRRHGP